MLNEQFNSNAIPNSFSYQIESWTDWRYRAMGHILFNVFGVDNWAMPWTCYGGKCFAGFSCDTGRRSSSVIQLRNFWGLCGVTVCCHGSGVISETSNFFAIVDEFSFFFRFLVEEYVWKYLQATETTCTYDTGKSNMVLSYEFCHLNIHHLQRTEIDNIFRVGGEMCPILPLWNRNFSLFPISQAQLYRFPAIKMDFPRFLPLFRP